MNNNWFMAPDKETVIKDVFESVKDEMQKFADKLHLTRIAKSDNIITYARTIVSGGEPYGYYISAKLENDKVIIYDTDTDRQIFEAKYIFGYACTTPSDWINEIDDNKNYDTSYDKYFSRLEIMYLYYAVTGRIEDGFNKNCGYLSCPVHKRKRLDLIGDCIQQWKKVAESNIADSVTVSWLCESVDDYVCVVYTDECTKLDEYGITETNAIVITSNTITDEDNVDRYCANYLVHRQDYSWQMVLDLRLLHTMIYDALTNAKKEEENELEEENMITNNDEYGITKTYEFDKDVFIPGDVYCIRRSEGSLCFRYFAIFERFDDDDRAVFVGSDKCDVISSYELISRRYMIQPVLSIHDYLTKNDMDFDKKFGIKETYEVDPNFFQIGAVYLIKDTTVSYESSYLGILRNVVLNPKNDESYVEFMSDVSDKSIRIEIPEIGETYIIKLVATVKDYLSTKETK